MLAQCDFNSLKEGWTFVKLKESFSFMQYIFCKVIITYIHTLFLSAKFYYLNFASCQKWAFPPPFMHGAAKYEKVGEGAFAKLTECRDVRGQSKKF